MKSAELRKCSSPRTSVRKRSCCTFYVRGTICNFLYRKAVSSDASEQRVLRSTPDWSETANNSEHLWVPTSASGDFCYVGESDCTVSTECLAVEREREREKS